jgi:hypothetical protein
MTRTPPYRRLAAAVLALLLTTSAASAVAAPAASAAGVEDRTAVAEARRIENIDPRLPEIQRDAQQPLNATRVNGGGAPLLQHAGLDAVAGAWARSQAQQRTAVPDPALASTLPRGASRSVMGVYVTTHHDAPNAVYNLGPQMMQIWVHDPEITDIGVGIAVEHGPGGTNRYTVVVIGAVYPHSTARPGELPLYRFYRPDSGTHFYTTSVAERDAVAGGEVAGEFWFEGPVGYVLDPRTAPAGTRELARFYQPTRYGAGTHFYTSSRAERDTVLATLPQYRLDGTAAMVHPAAGTGLVAMHRFFRPGTGTHFYTTSAAEVAQVKREPAFTYEGIAFYLRAAT